MIASRPRVFRWEAEDPEEKRARLAEAAAGARLARWKEGMTFVAVLVGVVAIAGFSLYVAADKAATAEERKWATSILASIVSAGVGYMVGSKQGR